MPQIPLYSHTPTASGSVNVRANPGILDGEMQAMQRLGQSVAQVGNQAFDFAAKKQDALNFAKLADGERQMREGFLLFQDELKRNGDEKTWSASWEMRAAEIEASVMKGVPPALKERMTAEVQGWKSLTVAQVRSVATEREIQRASAQVLDAADSDLKIGDVGGYKAKISEGAAKGLFRPDEAAKLLRTGEQKADWYAAFGMVNEDPAKALDMLDDRTDGGRPSNFTNLDEGQRYSLTQSARGALNSLRIETQESLFNRRQAGEVIGDEELDALVEKKLVKPEWAKRFAQEQRKGMGGVEGDAAAFSEVLVAIQEYDPLKDTGRTQYSKLFAQAQLLPDRMATDAVARLKDKADPQSVNNSAVAQAAERLIGESFEGGVYGKFDLGEEFVPGTTRKQKKVDRAVQAKAVQARAEVSDGIREYLKKKPNATEAEVVQEVYRLNQPFVDFQLRERISGVERDPLTLLIRSREADKAAEARLKAILEQYR